MLATYQYDKVVVIEVVNTLNDFKTWLIPRVHLLLLDYLGG